MDSTGRTRFVAIKVRNDVVKRNCDYSAENNDQTRREVVSHGGPKTQDKRMTERERDVS